MLYFDFLLMKHCLDIFSKKMACTTWRHEEEEDDTGQAERFPQPEIEAMVVSTSFVLTPEWVVRYEHDHVQELMVARAPTD
jgi:hypothetical protein